MGVFPEPALCADDVGGLMLATTTRTRRFARRRATGALALGLLAGFGLPQSAKAPAFFATAAQAHDRIENSPKAETALTAAAPTETRSAWNGLPLPEQDPPTTALIEDNLAALPRVTQKAGEDAVRFGERSVPLKVVDTIVKASEEAGVDPVYMMALADKESSFDTDAKAATSSAQGLFQFVRATWLELIRDFGARYGLDEEAASVKGSGPAITVAGGMKDHVLSLRNDPRVAALMAAELIKRDRDRIEARVGRPLSTAEMYLAHFLGSASAGRFLSLSNEKPDETAAKAFRSAAKANRSLFTQKQGGKRRHLTIAEFQNRIEDMIDVRLARYRGVTAVAAVADTVTPPEAEPSSPRRIEVTEALPPTAE
ncbi:transglycosylase SLT domain-containing protein [Methylobacterium sp. NFXW15]|uniref:transglycosylase SLT domain-containing protein n=1 Tax=Methylobacterium sp. NFXW15 TaxID=2819512 RepID=UPI003CF5A50A